MMISLRASSLLDLILVKLVFSKPARRSRAKAAAEESLTFKIGEGE